MTLNLIIILCLCISRTKVLQSISVFRDLVMQHLLLKNPFESTLALITYWHSDFWHSVLLPCCGPDIWSPRYCVLSILLICQKPTTCMLPLKPAKMQSNTFHPMATCNFWLPSGYSIPQATFVVTVTCLPDTVLIIHTIYFSLSIPLKQPGLSAAYLPVP